MYTDSKLVLPWPLSSTEYPETAAPDEFDEEVELDDELELELEDEEEDDEPLEPDEFSEPLFPPHAASPKATNNINPLHTFPRLHKKLIFMLVVRVEINDYWNLEEGFQKVNFTMTALSLDDTLTLSFSLCRDDSHKLNERN